MIQKIVYRKNREISENIDDISAKYRILTEISIEISVVGRHAHVEIFLVFSERYIGDISEISEIYRRYIGDISKISVKISEIYRDISGYIGNISK